MYTQGVKLENRQNLPWASIDTHCESGIPTTPPAYVLKFTSRNKLLRIDIFPDLIAKIYSFCTTPAPPKMLLNIFLDCERQVYPLVCSPPVQNIHRKISIWASRKIRLTLKYTLLTVTRGNDFKMAINLVSSPYWSNFESVSFGKAVF